ncbi:MAG: ShlB/FhaC/HecB family hemolysin secretion/activation protein [Pseudomonadota bacterium]
MANPPAGQATTADRERLLEAREEEAARAASEAGAPGLAIEGSVSAPPQEFPCFAITDIDIDGVETLSAETVQRVVSPYANTCMGQIAVDSILQALTQAYLDEGLITSRAYLPEQDLSTGRLLIVVIEGRIEDVRFARVEGDEALPGPPLRFNTAFPTRVGDLLNLRDLEQGIDQINRVPSTQANLDIAPGSEIGSSILNVVYGESDPVRLSFTLEADRKPDGYGQSASLGFEADNVVGVNDTFYLGLSGSETSNTLSASLSFPLGYWTFTGQATYSESESLLTATSRLFEPTTSASITADWLIHRDDRTKTRLTFALGRNDQERFVNGTALAPQRLSTIEFGWQREIFGQGLYFSPRMSLTFGRLMDDQSQVTPGSGPQIDYRLFKAGFTSRRSWENGASLFLSLSTQAADGPLFSAEKISIGGSGSLRGINGESVSGDRGFTARSELSLPVAAWAERNGSAALSAFAARGAFYTFLDLGAVRDLEGADWDYGAGLGIGLDYQVHETTSLRFYLGAPLTRSENLQTGGLEIGLSATVKVF